MTTRRSLLNAHENRAFACALIALLTALIAGCHAKAQRYDTKVEILSTRVMGTQHGKSAPSLIEFELRFFECPGEVKRVVRGDKALAECAGELKAGEKVPAAIDFKYDRERENYRGDLVQLGSCEVKLDPKEDANYETVQVCRDLKVSGVVIGVHCDKKREGELVEKCPWLRRL
ncbi:MAG TPA: hypothetical protein VFK05_14095 [Polyangiaceae bacterium]|nr:hypothetical protein [Polyangiaceae bacterium]